MRCRVRLLILAIKLVTKMNVQDVQPPVRLTLYNNLSMEDRTSMTVAILNFERATQVLSGNTLTMGLHLPKAFSKGNSLL